MPAQPPAKSAMRMAGGGAIHLITRRYAFGTYSRKDRRTLTSYADFLVFAYLRLRKSPSRVRTNIDR